MDITNPEPAPEWMLPEFDPTLIKVSELRSILLQNNITHSYTRKTDLIELFERELRPLTPKLLREHQSIRPSAHGIIDMQTGGLLQPEDKQPKRTPRKKASSVNLTDQESSTSAGPKRRTTKKTLAHRTAPESIGTDADAESTPKHRASAQPLSSRQGSKQRRSVANPVPDSSAQHPLKRKLDEKLAAAEEEDEVDQLSRESDFDRSHQMDIDRVGRATTKVAHQGGSSNKKNQSPIPVKRRKSDFPIQTSTIDSPHEEQESVMKKKMTKPKNRRTTLHEVIESGEANYSDYNPFQSGPDDDKSGSSGKKPTSSKRLSSAPRPSIAPPKLPKSSTTSNIPRPVSPAKQQRPTPRASMHYIDPADHPAPLPKSATTSNVRAVQTPQQVFARRSGPFPSGARPLERFGLDHKPSFDEVDTPEQVFRQLVPNRHSRRQPPPLASDELSLDPEFEHDFEHDVGSDERPHSFSSLSQRVRHPHFESLEDPSTSRAKPSTRRQSQLPPRSPYPIKPTLPAMSTPARPQVQRIRLDELIHTPAEKKLKINRSAVAQARAKSRPTALLSPSQGLSFLLRLSILAGILSLLNWYRDQSVKLGYCDTGASSNAQTRDKQIERLLEAETGAGSFGDRFGQVVEATSMLGLLPDCAICPAHAICERGKISRCDADYVLTQSSLGHHVHSWVPMFMRPRCLPDTAKLVKIVETANEINQILRVRRGEVVCGLGISGREEGATVGNAEDVKTFGVAEVALREQVKLRMGDAAGSGPEEEVFKLALKDLEKFQEVVERDGWLATASWKAMEMGWKCRMKLGMYKLIKRFKLILLTIICAAVGWVYIKVKLHRLGEEKKQVKELVEVTLTKLRDESWVHHTNPSLKPNAFIASAHLRDLILSYEHSPLARQKLWKKVETIIEGNSNIRTKLSEQRGESIKVWEWIGSYTGDLSLNASPGTRPSSGLRHATPTDRYRTDQPGWNPPPPHDENPSTDLSGGNASSRPLW